MSTMVLSDTSSLNRLWGNLVNSNTGDPNWKISVLWRVNSSLEGN